MDWRILILTGQLFMGCAWLILAEREGRMSVARAFFVTGSIVWFLLFVHGLITYIKEIK